MANSTSTATQQQPHVVRRILCLANSRKLSGRCVAGREITNDQPGPWIRPVSNREHQEVSWQERSYETGAEPKVLDIINIPLVEPRPHQFQQENWLLDPRFYWQKAGQADWRSLDSFIEPDGPLWLNHQSSHNGLNDRISMEQAVALKSSLRLVHLSRLHVCVFRPGEAFGNPKRRVQGRFALGSTQHRLWITDPVYEQRYLALPDASHQIGECYLTISLGEPHEGFAYKLIAAIIERAHTEPR